MGYKVKVAVTFLETLPILINGGSRRLLSAIVSAEINVYTVMIYTDTCSQSINQSFNHSMPLFQYVNCIWLQ